MGLRWITAGESHGPALIGIISGLPAGLEISTGEVQSELARRQKGAGRSSRQKIESDRAEFVAGIRHGKTIGSPVAVIIRNVDHANWADTMAVEAEPSDPSAARAFPRPGHADLAGMLKWGLDDARNVLERASGRTTAVTVALGALCRQYLRQFGTFLGCRLIRYGGECLIDFDKSSPTRSEIEDPSRILDFRRLSDGQNARIENAVRVAREKGDTLGGVLQVVAAHLPPGLGSCALPDERLDYRLGAAILGVPGIKAMEIGEGISQASMGGREADDRFAVADDPTHEPWFGRESNLAGGIEGGMSNGEPVCITAWMKPLSTVHPPLKSVDPLTRRAVDVGAPERSDVSALESVACVIEAVVALELARAHLDKFSGDSLSDVKKAYESYTKTIQ